MKSKTFWKIIIVFTFIMMCYNLSFFIVTFEWDEYITISEGGRITHHKEWKRFSPMDLILGIFWFCIFIWGIYNLKKENNKLKCQKGGRC